MGTEKLFKILAQTIGAYKRCRDKAAIGGTNEEWGAKHEKRALDLVHEHFPHGSGFDSGTTLDLDVSTEEKIVFSTSFHHMNQHGSYDGWTEHTVTVRPSLAFGFRLTISGPNRNEIKDVIGEAFDFALRLDVDDGRVPFSAATA